MTPLARPLWEAVPGVGRIPQDLFNRQQIQDRAIRTGR